MKRIKNESGFSGIGTMILVIAMLLIAVVAAGVLMHGGQLIAQQTERTGDQSKTKTAMAYKVIHVYGDRRGNEASNQDFIEWLFLKVTMEAGAPEADLRQLRIELIHTDSLTVGAEIDLNLDEPMSSGNTGDAATSFDTGWECPPGSGPTTNADVNTTFTAREIRDPELLWDTTTNWYIGGGSVLELGINISTVLENAHTGLEYDTQDELVIRLIPKHGQVTYLTVTAPDAFTDRYVDLY